MGDDVCGAEACADETLDAEWIFVVLEVPAGLQLGDGQGAPAE